MLSRKVDKISRSKKKDNAKANTLCQSRYPKTKDKIKNCSKCFNKIKSL